MIKILLLADVNSPHTQRWLQAMASHAQLEVAVFSFTAQQIEVPARVKVFTGQLESSIARKPSIISKAFIYFKCLPKLREVTKQFQPDVVHAMYASSYGLLGAILNHPTFYVSGWGTDVFSFPRKNIFTKAALRFVFSRAKRLYSTSNYMANEMRKYTGKAVHVIPYGVDTNVFSPGNSRLNGIAANDIVIGTVKSHEPTYGINVLVHAFALLVHQRPDVSLKLLLVGNGSQTESLKQLTKDLNISSRVTFAGSVPHNEVAAMHRACDIFVAPTLHESFGVSLVEAMSTGKPCVVSDIPPYREINDGSEAVVFFKTGESQDLCEKLSVLIDDVNQRQRLGGAARQRVLQAYDAARIEREIVNQYLTDQP